MDDLQRARDAAVAEDKHLFVKNHTFYVWEPASLSQSMWGGEMARPFAVLPGQGIGGSASTTRTNPTFFPDDFITSWQPVFLIRHPALTFESWYRAELRVEPIDINLKSWNYLTTFQYSRQLYDWFMSNCSNEDCEKENDSVTMGKPRPVVIDADDVIDGKAMSKLCEVCGMDPEHIRYEWEESRPSNTRGANPREVSYLSGIWDSTTIDKSKSSQGLDVAAKYDQWKEEFGIVAADVLYTKVKSAMPDYEYLKSRKL
ncbi:uncharacterized protein GIQ15_00800 [Arthroderma uncinatum]|uniref:uncharacterized protein n=1 Tax=Arthroderma uncinatum TaxID=74035 RepID=UPI00144AC1D3|nr:uncharacterized protein GIQ15_00800 [Arthroderma uncinatum]KAF3491283.1 hypothetical protein GIQ15_00800 [Arthroderma uncinatum]